MPPPAPYIFDTGRGIPLFGSLADEPRWVPSDATPLVPEMCANSGDGWLPTVEEQGLAAMTLAQILETNGKGGPVDGLLTHADRTARFGGSMISDQPRLAEIAPASSPAV